MAASGMVPGVVPPHPPFLYHRRVSPGVEGAVRMVGSVEGAEAGSATGVLEIFHAGAWGTLCEGQISEGYYYYIPESVEALFDPDFVDVPPPFTQARPLCVESFSWNCGLICQ